MWLVCAEMKSQFKIVALGSNKNFTAKATRMPPLVLDDSLPRSLTTTEHSSIWIPDKWKIEESSAAEEAEKMEIGCFYVLLTT